MWNVLSRCFSPLLSLVILSLGSGLFMTLITVRLDIDGYSSWVIGAVSSAYYAGLVFGSFRVEPFIFRVGHIRAYAAFASLLGVVTMLQGLIVDPWTWIVFRFLGGFFVAGLFVVIESWLIASGRPSIRGQMLALYMIGLYAGQAAGQFLLTASDPQTLVPFAIVTILCSLSVVPLSITFVASPQSDEASALSFIKLYRISPSGVLGCFASGLVLGSIYGLFPLYILDTGLSLVDVSTVMGLVIFGGMALQYPVGRLSDTVGRRPMLVGVSFTTVTLSFAMITSVDLSRELFFMLAVLFGGCTFTLYPLSISHACDYLDTKDIVAATQGLLLAYGIGAMLGPSITPLFMNHFGSQGFFIYIIIITGTLGSFFLWRRTQREAIPVDEQQDFVVMPSSAKATGLDPRSEETQEENS